MSFMKATKTSYMDTNQKAHHINTMLNNSIDLQKPLLETRELTPKTSIVPLGYYDWSNKKGHQIALLVHEQPDRTIVAVSDTGETALEGFTTSSKYTAIVALGHTDLATGRGILDFGITMIGDIRNAEILRIVRMSILDKCGCTFVNRTLLAGSDANSPQARNDDRHLAVRFLSSGKNRIVSHTQRSGTCTFYSTLWLLGIADALIERPKVADHILLGTTETVTENNEYILDRICHIDKEMKRLALGSLIMPAHALTAELVAADYAGCAWLNTEWLRDKLTESSKQTPISAAVLHTKCIVRKVPNTTPFLRNTGPFTLRVLAEWIRKHGYGGTGELKSRINVRAAEYTTFVYMARDLLIKPVTRGLVLSTDDQMPILAISMYLSSLPAQLISPEKDTQIADTITGMAMRCVRYIAMIVKQNEKHTPQPQSESDSMVVVLPAIYQTSLPWVASEYYALQEETKATASLLFDYRNIDSLSKRIKHVDQPKPSEVRLISTNEFHAALIAKKVQSIKDDTAEVDDLKRQYKKEYEKYKKHYKDHQKLPGSLVDKQRDISDIESRIAKTQAYVDNTRKLELSPVQLEALRYIQCNRDLAVLNVCTALLVHEEARAMNESFETFIFGTKTGGSTRFCTTRYQDTSTIDERSTDNTLY
jgi:hypothetical protein